MEYSSVVLGRALEIQSLIHKGELDGQITRASTFYKYRTGELRDFIELAKNAFDMGSRRVSVARLEMDQTYGSF
jgi:hypothetical protein